MCPVVIEFIQIPLEPTDRQTDGLEGPIRFCQSQARNIPVGERRIKSQTIHKELTTTLWSHMEYTTALLVVDCSIPLMKQNETFRDYFPLQSQQQHNNCYSSKITGSLTHAHAFSLSSKWQKPLDIASLFSLKLLDQWAWTLSSATRCVLLLSLTDAHF